MRKKLMSIKDFTAEEIRFQAVWSSIGIPPRLAEATLTGYQPICPEKASALQKCQAFAEQGMENISQGLGLFLQGPVGTGKSHLSVAVLRTIIANNLDRFGVPPSQLGFVNDYTFDGYYCSMVSVVELLETLRESVGNIKKKELVRRKLHRIKSDDIVILDDIGAEKPSEFIEAQLFAIIDLRYRTRRSTFFTSNCSLKQLETQIGARSVSRIFGMCEGVKVGGEDWRKRGLG
jgi:DNA replication protein DnaC